MVQVRQPQTEREAKHRTNAPQRPSALHQSTHVLFTAQYQVNVTPAARHIRSLASRLGALQQQSVRSLGLKNLFTGTCGILSSTSLDACCRPESFMALRLKASSPCGC